MATEKPVAGFKSGNRFGKWETGSRFRPSTNFYLRDRSWIAGGGAKGGGPVTIIPLTIGLSGLSPAGPGVVPGRWRDPNAACWTINIVGSGTPKTAGGGGTGERDWGSTMAIGPWTTGRGNTASPHQTPLDAGGMGAWNGERPVTIIPLTIGLSVTGKKPVLANRLPVPKNKRF